MGRHRKTTYETWKSSCYFLQYHIILVTKYRHPVIKTELKDSLYEHAKDYFNRQDKIKLLKINGTDYHIHLLIQGHPNMNLAEVIGAYKASSSRYIRKLYKETLQPYYWKPYFWSKSYFITGVSETSETLIQEYIQNQTIDSSRN